MTKHILDAVGLALVVFLFLCAYVPDLKDSLQRAQRARKAAEKARQNIEAQRLERLWRK